MEKVAKDKNGKEGGQKEGPEKGGSEGASMMPPAFNLSASPVQRQTPDDGDAGGAGTVQERFASHSLTEADLSDEYVTGEFAKLSIDGLFEYRRQATVDAVKAHILTLVDARERDPYQSYLGKQFTVNDPQAVLRDEAGTILKYQTGDEIPEGKNVGDNKVIPQGTVVYITDITDDVRRVHAEDWGWTNIGNIQGGMFNETLSIDRAEYESTDPNHKTVATHTCTIHSNTPTTGYPQVRPVQRIPHNAQVTIVETSDDNAHVLVAMQDGTQVWTSRGNLSPQPTEGTMHTVTDRDARIRRRSVEYPAAGGTVAQGQRVIVLDSSSDTEPAGQYKQIARTKKNTAGEYVRDEAQQPVWVQANDLADNWADINSDNSRWVKSSEDRVHGVYLGQMDVVRVIGQESSTGRQEAEKVSADLVPSYQDLQTAAAAAGHNIIINSAFRSYPEQQELYDLYLAGRGNLAARPGRSNHQVGIAIDINTGGFGTDLYRWMKANGPTYHFTRTVQGEHWHWEYRPEGAAEHGYRMPWVTDG